MLPTVEDPEGDEVFIDASLEDEFNCKCVKIMSEKSSTGSSAKAWIEIDRTNLTMADNREITGNLEIIDGNYQVTHQKTIYTV